MKSVILPDHIPVNKFTLEILNGPPLTVTHCTGLDQELDKIMLPDRTAASGGRSKPTDFTIKIPAHHTTEVKFMDDWFQQGREVNVPLTYKRTGTLGLESLSGVITPIPLLNIFVTKKGLPELDADDEGKMATIEYGMSAELQT